MKKLLLDENLPIDLRLCFSNKFEVFTVKYMGWDSWQNGKLLNAMSENGFYALITADKKMIYQQNLEKHKIRIMVIDCANTLVAELTPFVPLIESELETDNGPLAVLISKK